MRAARRGGEHLSSHEAARTGVHAPPPLCNFDGLIEPATHFQSHPGASDGAPTFWITPSPPALSQHKRNSQASHGRTHPKRRSLVTPHLDPFHHEDVAVWSK